MDGCPSEVTIFHSFHLRVIRMKTKYVAVCAYSDCTRALVVGVFDLWTSFVATLTSLRGFEGPPFDGSAYGMQSQTLPQLPKPI